VRPAPQAPSDSHAHHRDNLYGRNNGIICRAQFSILITAVILSAIVPTLVAQRFFSSRVRRLTRKEEIDVEDEEFAPAHGSAPNQADLA
jgi:regulator of extracellular matrix RemA (YlzA/DUF370 family)